jgi:thiamine transporter
MLPILVLAVRRGVVPGMIAGALFGFVDLTIEPYILTWAQVLLDYPLAFGAVGLAGFGASAWRTAVDSGREARAAWTVVLPWVTVGVGARFVFHFVSGVVFFASAAPKGTPVALYSAMYNATYLVPSLVLALVPAMILLPVLERAVPVPGRPIAAR